MDDLCNVLVLGSDRNGTFCDFFIIIIYGYLREKFFRFTEKKKFDDLMNIETLETLETPETPETKPQKKS